MIAVMSDVGWGGIGCLLGVVFWVLVFRDRDERWRR